jgi:hypothetical protein
MVTRSVDAETGYKSEVVVRLESPTVSTISTDTESSLAVLTVTGARTSILKASSARSDTIRTDRAGNIIVPGSKSHRVCFADEVHSSAEPIAKVHHVESWKSWNWGNRFVDGENSCVCTIS